MLTVFFPAVRTQLLCAAVLSALCYHHTSHPGRMPCTQCAFDKYLLNDTGSDAHGKKSFLFAIFVHLLCTTCNIN